MIIVQSTAYAGKEPKAYLCIPVFTVFLTVVSSPIFSNNCFRGNKMYKYLLVVLFMTGCSVMPKMSHSENDASYDKDYYECTKEAEHLVMQGNSAADNMMRPSRVIDKTVLCMKARGWSEID